MKPDIVESVKALYADADGHVVEGKVITPVRAGADIPTFQIVFDEDDSARTIVNPALSPNEYEYYQQQLEGGQGVIQT